MVAQSEIDALLKQIDELGEDEIRRRLKLTHYSKWKAAHLETELERRDRARSNEDSPEAQKVFVDCEAHGEAAVREMLKRNVFPPSTRKWAEV